MKPLLRDMVRTGASVATVTGLALLPAYLFLHQRTSRQAESAPRSSSGALSFVTLDEGWNSMGVAINDQGEVAGTAIKGDDTIRAFVVRGKKASLLPLPKGAPLSVASDINESGTVVGNAGGEEKIRGVFWRGEQINILTSGKRNTIATTISKDGTAAGIALDSRNSTKNTDATAGWDITFNNPYHFRRAGRYEYLFEHMRSGAFEYTDQNLQIMLWGLSESRNAGFTGMLWNRSGDGKAIGDFVPQAGSAEGSLVGMTLQKDELVPAFFKAGKIGRLPLPEGAEMAVPVGVNSNEIAVGAGFSEGKILPVGWSKGKTGYLPVPGGRQGIAISINNEKVAVGLIESEDGMAHAAVWKEGKVVDLNDLIDKDSGWTLVQARDINSKGQIVGTAVKGERFTTFVISLRQR